jgi:hypothetical protein
MAKAKSIRDNKEAVLPASNGLKPDSSKRIELTDANAPIIAVKVLSEIRDELKRLNDNMTRVHDDLQDIIADHRDV